MVNIELFLIGTLLQGRVIRLYIFSRQSHHDGETKTGCRPTAAWRPPTPSTAATTRPHGPPSTTLSSTKFAKNLHRRNQIPKLKLKLKITILVTVPVSTPDIL